MCARFASFALLFLQTLHLSSADPDATVAALKHASDSSGSISGAELLKVMTKGHLAWRSKDADVVKARVADDVGKTFAELDKNGDGRIETSEAFTRTEPKKEHQYDDPFIQHKGLWMSKRQQLLWAFADGNGDNALDLGEFRVFHHPELHSTSEIGEQKYHSFLASVLLARADADGDGKLSWDEFSTRKEAERELYNWHKDGNDHGPVSEREAHAENARKQEREDFNKLGDADADGLLTLDELTEMITRQQNINIELDHRQALSELDTDADGAISAAEAARANKLSPHLHEYFKHHSEL
jgi:Ca2+-binding EF-hand superfamily protein